MKKIFALMLIGSGFMNASVYATDALNPVIEIKNHAKEKKEAEEYIKNIISNADDEITDNIKIINNEITINIKENYVISFKSKSEWEQPIKECFNEKEKENEFKLIQDKADNLKDELKKIDAEKLSIEIKAGEEIDAEKLSIEIKAGEEEEEEEKEEIKDPELVKFFIDNFEKLRKLNQEDIRELFHEADKINNKPKDKDWENTFKKLPFDPKVNFFVNLYKEALITEKKTPEIEKFIADIYTPFEEIFNWIKKYNNEKEQNKKSALLKTAIKKIDKHKIEILNDILGVIDQDNSFEKNISDAINIYIKKTEEYKENLLKDATEKATYGVLELQARRAEQNINKFVEILNRLLEGDKSYKQYLPSKKSEEERKAVQEILMIVNNIKPDKEEVAKAINDKKVTDTERLNVLMESINSTWEAVKEKVDALDKTFDKKEGKNGNVKYKKGWQGKLIGMLNHAIPMNIKGDTVSAPQNNDQITRDIKDFADLLSHTKATTKKWNELKNKAKKCINHLKNEKITFDQVKEIKNACDKFKNLELKGKKKEKEEKERSTLIAEFTPVCVDALCTLYKDTKDIEIRDEIEKMLNNIKIEEDMPDKEKMKEQIKKTLEKKIDVVNEGNGKTSVGI